MKKKFTFQFKILNTFLLFALVIGCSQSAKKGVEGGSDYYSESYRPQYHFSPEYGWMNDPNGMFYYNGEYHLFYQYYPDSTVWGPMHWGHAVSEDLVHWKHLPIALYPDSSGYIFSGSAVVDWENTSGFGKDDITPLVAIFTNNDMTAEKAGEVGHQTQGIAYSLDDGRTWIKYRENPVLENPGIWDFRDPKVSWDEGIQKWIMTLAVHDHIEFYSSANLIEWKKESEFGKGVGAHGGVWECPDLFQLENKETGDKKWILLVSINPGGPNGGSATQYFVGDFDGNRFTTEQIEEKWIDYGRDNYAGVTWNDIPKRDGRRLFIGWMSNWQYAEKVPTEKWRSTMTIPRELILGKSGTDYFVNSVPIEELKQLRSSAIINGQMAVSDTISVDNQGLLLNNSELKFSFNMTKNIDKSSVSTEFGIILKNNLGEKLIIGYAPTSTQVFTDRNYAGVDTFSHNFASRQTAKYHTSDKLDFHVFIDEASVEIFINNGDIVMTDIVFPTVPYNGIEVYAKDGEVMLEKAEIWNLKSVW